MGHNNVLSMCYYLTDQAAPNLSSFSYLKILGAVSFI